MKGCSQGVMLRSPGGSVGSVGAAWGEEAGIHVGDGGTEGGSREMLDQVEGDRWGGDGMWGKGE